MVGWPHQPDDGGTPCRGRAPDAADGLREKDQAQTLPNRASNGPIECFWISRLWRTKKHEGLRANFMIRFENNASWTPTT